MEVGTEFQGHPQSQRSLEARLSFMRPCLKPNQELCPESNTAPWWHRNKESIPLQIFAFSFNLVLHQLSETNSFVHSTFVSVKCYLSGVFIYLGLWMGIVLCFGESISVCGPASRKVQGILWVLHLECEVAGWATVPGSLSGVLTLGFPTFIPLG